ncbi:MAG: hypothetical protein CSA33_08155 [Desulfobulbus propionicus]|nr:MAG: hypothetical protein CSA33_08155 [Desulfobulbus propionicus]
MSKQQVGWTRMVEHRHNTGFTMVELMITLAISGMVMGAIYGAYISQQRTYVAQDDVAEMQQNVRAAIYAMVSDLRMAGYDDGSGAGATIEEAHLNDVKVSCDLDGDGKTDQSDEIIQYSMYQSGSDGIWRLGRKEVNGGSTIQAVAENFNDATSLEFQYLDAEGNTTTVLDDIRAIRICLLARASKAAQDYENTGLTYTSPSGTVWGPFNDNVRRRLYVTTVNLRNMGL